MQLTEVPDNSHTIQVPRRPARPRTGASSEHDDRRLRSFGLVPSLSVNFQDNAEKPSFEARYVVGFHRYTRTNSFDRVSQYFTAEYRWRPQGQVVAVRG
jgi:hypothetical protein